MSRYVHSARYAEITNGQSLLHVFNLLITCPVPGLSINQCTTSALTKSSLCHKFGIDKSSSLTPLHFTPHCFLLHVNACGLRATDSKERWRSPRSNTLLSGHCLSPMEGEGGRIFLCRHHEILPGPLKALQSSDDPFPPFIGSQLPLLFC